MAYISTNPYNNQLTLVDSVGNPLASQDIMFHTDPASGLKVTGQFFLQPDLIVVPAGGVFVNFDLSITISALNAPYIRIGSMPGLGETLPTGHTWHGLTNPANCRMAIQLCMIAPPPGPQLVLELTLVTDEGGGVVTNEPAQPYQFNTI